MSFNFESFESEKQKKLYVAAYLVHFAWVGIHFAQTAGIGFEDSEVKFTGQIKPTYEDIRSTIESLKTILKNPSITPKQIHDEWQLDKENQGWMYGPQLDNDRKTHPLLIDYHLLPPSERLKDALQILAGKAALEMVGLL